MKDGKKYVSTYDTLLACPDIDSIYFKYKKIDSDNPLSFDHESIQFYIDFDATGNYANNYKWEFVETWEFNSPEIIEFGKPDRFKINTDENFEQIKPYVGITIEKEDLNAIQQRTDTYYDENKDIFFERIENKKIRDCHGDLHMEHISLEDPVSIFDCIEFNDRFRYTDTLADIAFLCMDLEYRGGENYASTLWDLYTDITGEKGMDSLLTFYKVYRAYVRGKVNSFQIDDEQISVDKKEQAIRAAKKYFQLAKHYIVPNHP